MLVRPNLEYITGVLVWNHHTQNNIDILEKIHKSATRFIVHDHRRATSVVYIEEGGGHVRIAKVQHTLAKAVHALGCLYLAIIMSNYSRFIMSVKKLQFPP